ncbi:PucR family transcriptional regulator [Actinomadura rugatobispora]|uniref:PucR family transcriptional regulator n=1 Tax=Actinomadura rugatobispora TaxID=1994 RepID=A0ABW0ZY88_9ACTN|nr:PucR family transcriptional regulator ligand-binding domain-containing protein [Actinomadura rugatobispora]
MATETAPAVLRVADLLAQGDLALSLVAGHGSLGRRIRRVRVTDLPGPGAQVRGGDLVLTTGRWYRSPAECAAFAASLAGRGAAALVVGPAAPDGPPVSLVVECERRGLPLIAAADDRAFAAIAERVAEAHSPAGLRRRLAAAAHGAGGVRGVVRLLREETELDCWVLSPLATVLASAGDPPAREDVERAWLHATGAAPPPAAALAVRPIRGADGGVQGHLVCPGGDAPGAAGGERAMRAALPVLGAELDRIDAGRRREQRRVRDLLDAAARGADHEAVAGGLRSLGADPGAPTVAVAVALDAALPRAWIVGGALARTAAPDRAGRVLLCERDDTVIALVNGPAGAERVEAALRDVAGRYPLVLRGRTVAAGVSEATGDAGGLAAAVEAARRVLRHARDSAGPVTVVREADLGSHRLLLAVLPDDVRRSYRERFIGPLEDHDARHGSELVRTLDLFLETSGSWQRTADLLHVHVNTLRYRVRRIEMLTGRSMGSMSGRADLYLALRCPPPS